MLPLSVGLDYQVISFSGCCKLLAVAAFPVAYYQNRRDDATENKSSDPFPG